MSKLSGDKDAKETASALEQYADFPHPYVFAGRLIRNAEVTLGDRDIAAALHVEVGLALKMRER